MAKHYISEQELEVIFKTQFDRDTWESFEEWLDREMEEGEIELVEFGHYEVSKLDYRPAAKILGANGNIFNLMGIAKRALIVAGKQQKGNEMCNRVVTQAKNYDEALLIIMEYVEVE